MDSNCTIYHHFEDMIDDKILYFIRFHRFHQISSVSSLLKAFLGSRLPGVLPEEAAELFAERNAVGAAAKDPAAGREAAVLGGGRAWDMKGI